MLAAFSVALAGCSADPAPELAVPELRRGGDQLAENLILIVNDAMRRDRVGVYGGPALTPHFDEFAADNLLFWRAYSPSPWTKPSMVSLLTSLYPSQHGIVSHPKLRPDEGRSLERSTDVLGNGFTTLPELFHDAGFATAAFVGNPWLRREFGFAQGFDRYDDSLADWDVPGGVVTDKGLGWLEQVGSDKPFFLYLHYMNSHRPYGRLSESDIEDRLADLRADKRRLSSWAERDIENAVLFEGGGTAATAGVAASITLLEMAYDRGVEEFDLALGQFLAGFRRHEAYQRTAIVVVSDHGEALYARGWGNHGGALYEDEIAIPLAARLPGITSRGPRVESLVGLVDLLPTLCSYLGVGVPADAPIFGMDWLAPVGVAGSLRDRYLVIEGVMNLPGHRAIRFGDYKLLSQPHALPYDPVTRALFRVNRDPGELNNLLTSANEAQAAGRLFDDLLGGGAMAVSEFSVPQAEEVLIDPEVVERLRALGYIK